MVTIMPFLTIDVVIYDVSTLYLFLMMIWNHKQEGFWKKIWAMVATPLVDVNGLHHNSAE
jgi:hypothetical protein